MPEDPSSLSLESLGETFLARYRPGVALGRGASGCVFMAHQLELDRPVVVKVLELHGPGPSVDRARFKKEAEVLARLSHPRVVRILDFGATDRFAWLTYPDDRGLPLTAWMEPRGVKIGRDPVDPGLVRRLLDEVLDGLVHVHARGIIHRDLKPTNLLVLPDGSLRIIDFGLARDLGAATVLTATGTILGTPRYMAPDQIRGGEPDPADDLYAVGVLGYELLTGTAPFLGVSVSEVLTRQLSFDPPPARAVAPQVPEELSVLVADLLAKSRRERPPSAEAALARLRGTEGIQSPSPPRTDSPAPRPKTRLLAWPALAAAATALALGLIRPPEPSPGPGREWAAGAAGLAGPSPPPGAIAPDQAAAERVRAEILEALSAQVGLPPRERWLPPPDVAGWPTAFARLPRTRAVIEWVAAGGDPAGLEPGARSVLLSAERSLGEWHADLPFHPWLSASPASVPLVPVGASEASLAKGAALEGWLATAVLAARRAEAFNRDREAIAATLGRGGPCPPEMSTDTWKVAQLWLLVETERVSNLTWFASRIYPQGTPIRSTLVTWLAPGARALAEAVHAASRALAGTRDPVQARVIVLWAVALIDGVGSLTYGESAFAEPRTVVWGRRPDPELALLALVWSTRAANARIKAETGMNLDRTAIGNLAVTALGPADGSESGRARILVAFTHAMDWVERAEAYELLPELVTAVRASLGKDADRQIDALLRELAGVLIGSKNEGGSVRRARLAVRETMLDAVESAFPRQAREFRTLVLSSLR